jgi:hypothetical protein
MRPPNVSAPEVCLNVLQVTVVASDYNSTERDSFIAQKDFE